MALSFVAVGTADFSNAADAATVDPAPPAHNAGDLLVLAVGVHTSTRTIAIPADYTAVSNAEASGGGGTFGADAGPSRAKLMFRIAPDTSTSPVSVTIGGSESNSVAGGIFIVFRADSGLYDVAGGNGIDATTGSPFTATMNVNPGLEAGDHCAVVGSVGTDAASYSGQTLTATGIATTVTELAEPSTTTGNDMEMTVCRATVNTGTASTAPTFSATASGTTTNVRGPIVLARIREIIPALAEIPNLVMAPRLAP